MGMFDDFAKKAQALAGGNVGGKGGAVEEFPRTLNEDDFMGTTAVAVVTGSYQVLGTYTVLSQQEYMWGQGEKQNDANQGYVYVSLESAVHGGGGVLGGTQMEGKVRLTAYDANDRLLGVVFEEHTSMLRGSKTNRELKIPLPLFRVPLVAEDSYLAIEFKPEAAGTVSYTTSEFLLPVTNRWISQK